MEINEAAYLLKRYFNDEATLAEQEALFQALEENRDDEQWQSLMSGLADSDSSDPVLEEKYEKILRNILNTKPKAKVRRLYYFAAAASVAIILLAGYFYLFNPSRTSNPVAQVDSETQVIEPGGNKAVLTLADGSQIVLDSAFNGALTQQGGVTVIKLDDGELSYQKNKAGEKTMVYNTITTPRGGMYQLTLSDGTKVWLNAESSLRYPTAFAGNDRKVELSGEGYFEVAHDASKPFFVNTGSMSVQVLGTRFNVNAYADDGNLKTTLFEGSVEVNAGGSKVRLKPGEQARLQLADNDLKSLGNIDMDQVIAWKEGYFSFQNASLKEVLLQIARWYDVDFRFEGDITSRKFGGGISRNSDLNDLLKILERSRVHFRIEDRTIIVKP